MKRLLCILCLLFAFTGNVFAENATIQNVTTTHNLKINYPVIILKNKEASEEMNRFISKKMLAYKKTFNSRNCQEGIIDYKVMYEDDDFLSIAFTYWWYYKNAAHGMYNTSGIVFDKNSGKLVNLKHFVLELNVKNLNKKVHSGELQVKSSHDEAISLTEPWHLDRVSHSYYIDADKSVYLIYQPYELAPYAAGNTYIKITQDEAKKLKD